MCLHKIQQPFPRTNKLNEQLTCLRSMSKYFQLKIHHDPKSTTTIDCLPQLYKGENCCVECPKKSIKFL